MMNTQPQEGYKHTPFGFVPEEWEVDKLGKSIDLLTGFAFPSNKFSTAGVRLVRGSNVKRGVLDWRGDITQYWPQHDPELERYELRAGDIVIALDGALVGKSFASVGENDLPCYLVQRVARLRGTSIDQKFLGQLLHEGKFGVHVDSVKTNTAIPHISPADVRSFLVPLPPLPEQRRIADILSTWDAAIETLTALIAEKEKLKKGLMQRLLSGKVRLNGFEEAWEYKSIRAFAKEVIGKNTDDAALTVLSCTKYDGLVPSLEYFGRKVYSNNLKTYKVVPIGCFAYATNHIEEGSLGYQSRYERALISPMYTLFKTDDSMDDGFLFRVLKSARYINEYKRRMEGSIDRRGGLRWEEFSKIEVPVPAIEEQRAIAAVASAAEEEIKSLRTQLDAYKEQKRGLMQQLLTGKKRVNNVQ